MAQSINNVCPTINNIAVTPNQADLARLCSAMVGNSLQVQGQPNPLGLPSLGLNASGLQGALQQLNGGAELVVPTSQTSRNPDHPNHQADRRNRGKVVSAAQSDHPARCWPVRGRRRPGQIAALSTLEPDGPNHCRARRASPICLFDRTFGGVRQRARPVRQPGYDKYCERLFFQQRRFHRQRPIIFSRHN